MPDNGLLVNRVARVWRSAGSVPAGRDGRIAWALATAASVVVSAVAVVGATDAAFTASTATPANAWSAGTVWLSNDSSAAALFTAAGATPGDTGARCVTVTYTGSLAAGVRLYVTGVGGALAPHTDVSIAVGTGATPGGSCTGFTMTGELFNGTLSSLAAGHGAFGTGLGGFAPSAGPATAAYRISWQLDDAAPNSAQNTTAAASVTWEARNDATAPVPASPYVSLLRDDGATGLWRLNEPTGTTSTEQIDGAHATYSASGLTRGVPGPGTTPGGATTFDDTTAGTVTVPAVAAAPYRFGGTDPFTVEAWVRRPATGTDWMPIAHKLDYTSGNIRQGWQLWMTPHDVTDGSGGEMVFARSGGPAVLYNRDEIYSATLTPGVWHHVAGTYDGATIRLYVDGQLVSSGASSRSITPTTEPLHIGHDSFLTSFSFTGGLADVAVYPVALTQSRIQAHHTAR